MNLFTKKPRPTANSKQQTILDTCAVIDGRITAIVKAGFVPGQIIIPQFVLAELQYLADYGDSHKRERARFGLDVIRELQDLRQSDVAIARHKFENIKEVDDKLVALAKQLNAMLYTTDYNLNKVAQIEGVTVLNVNELAHALRPNHLPGERLEVKITQTGQEKTQGVGYLDDGTMVVVEKAGQKIGQKLTVELSRMLQTQAGKMMFAVLPDAHKRPASQPQQPVHKPQAQPPAKQPEHKEKPQPEQRQQQKPANKPRPQVHHAQPRAQAKTQEPRGERQRKFPPRRQRQTPEDSLIRAINERNL